jgi:hypothetical protein
MHSSSRPRLGLFLVLLLVCTAGLGLSTSLRGVARAAGPKIWLSQTVGPPTARVQVHGNGFGLSETVLVDFDTTQVGTATTDATGKFVVPVIVLKSTLPGTHTVQVMGQSSGQRCGLRRLVCKLLRTEMFIWRQAVRPGCLDWGTQVELCLGQHPEK